MTIPTVTELVFANTARFVRLQNRYLWYVVDYKDIEGVEHAWEFPIPLEETRGGVFLASEKAILLMRWIRQRIIALTAGDEPHIPET